MVGVPRFTQMVDAKNRKVRSGGRGQYFYQSARQGVIWSLTPESKTYSQTKFPDNYGRFLDPRTRCDWTEEGIEIIEGRRCRRFVGHYLDALGPVGSAHEICFIDAETGVHSRVVTYDKEGKLALTVDCLNAVVGPPPRSVFEMPEGYKRAYHKRKRR
jgi:hypothetical protein